MSLLWRTAVSQEQPLPFKIDMRDAYPKQGWVHEARVPTEHPLYEEHGSLAGYAHCTAEPDPEDPGGYNTHIHMIEVNPGYRGMGVGKALLKHVMEHSRDPIEHGGVTPEGAHLWRSVTGEDVRPTKRPSHPSERNWRWA